MRPRQESGEFIAEIANAKGDYDDIIDETEELREKRQSPQIEDEELDGQQRHIEELETDVWM